MNIIDQGGTGRSPRPEGNGILGKNVLSLQKKRTTMGPRLKGKKKKEGDLLRKESLSTPKKRSLWLLDQFRLLGHHARYLVKKTRKRGKGIKETPPAKFHGRGERNFAVLIKRKAG